MAALPLVSDVERLFFIYDQAALEDQDADIKDSVLYCCPKLIPDSKLIVFIGQIVGVLEWAYSFVGSPATAIRLSHSIVAVKHVDHYILCYSGDDQVPEYQLCRLLENLYELFCFFHGSFDRFNSVCRLTNKCLKAEVEAAFDCYLPFVRRFGDSVSSAFQGIPSPFVGQERFNTRRACSDLVQKAKNIVPGARAGCVLYRERILLTQLPPSMTLKMCIFKPRQQHLSSCHVDNVDHLPEGVRLLSVFITDEEFAHLTSLDMTQCKVKQRNVTGNRSSVPGLPQSSDTENGFSDSIPSSCKGEESALTSPHQTIESKPRTEGDNASTSSLSEHSFRQSRVSECNDFSDQQPSAKSMSGNVEPMELYILGNSQSVFLLLTDPGSIRDAQLRLKLWVLILQRLADIESSLHDLSNWNVIDSYKTANVPSHIAFNSRTMELSGSATSPITAGDHSFTEASVQMHEALRKTPTLSSMSLSNSSSVYFACRRDSKELFYRYPRQIARTESESNDMKVAVQELFRTHLSSN